MGRNLSNVSQSVHDRLLNQAREADRSFNELLLYYGIERFLYRLAQTGHVDGFALKGALLLHVQDPDLARSTRDIDVLDLRRRNKEQIREVVRDAMLVEVSDDGMEYNPESIEISEIRPEAEYQGLRITFRGYLGTARVPMQIDVGTGDVLEPEPVRIEYPELLSYGRPRLLGYPLESVIAEKFEAMVDLGTVNTRMKDFYDVWRLSKHQRFEGSRLSAALKATFERRGTPVPDERPEALTEAFLEFGHKQTQWTSFLEKTRLDASPSLADVLADLGDFLLHPAQAVVRGETLSADWVEGGPWSS